MHNDWTLNVMDKVTTFLGNKLREFNEKTCSAFVTYELECEYNARVRQESKRSAAKGCPRGGGADTRSYHNDSERTGHQQLSITAIESEGTVAGKRSNSNVQCLKTLNLNTYKFHSLGDYTNTIRRYGTTNSYSTELVRIIFLNGLWIL